jgi:hypothetical protein
MLERRREAPPPSPAGGKEKAQASDVSTGGESSGGSGCAQKKGWLQLLEACRTRTFVSMFMSGRKCQGQLGKTVSQNERRDKNGISRFQVPPVTCVNGA